MTAHTAVQTRPAASPLSRIGSIAIRACLPLVALALRLVSLNYRALRWTLETVPPAITDRLSRERALVTAREAARRVPAYREHLEAHGYDPGRIDRFDDLPETDKASYIDVHPMADR